MSTFVHGGRLHTTSVAMSNPLHKNSEAAQLPVIIFFFRLGSTNCVAVFQLISARMITRLLELPIQLVSDHNIILAWRRFFLIKETWLSCITIEISASVSLRRSVRKMKDYLWILNFRQSRSLCILAEQHLQSQLNGRGLR